MSDHSPVNEPEQHAPRRWVRGLRIGVSVFFGLLTVMLAMLWVRSYWKPVHLSATLAGFTYASMYSYRGSATFSAVPLPAASLVDFGWDIATERQVNVFVKPHRDTPFAIDVSHAPQSMVLRAPHWFVSLCSAIIALIPWMSLRFSSRTMLTMTTLVAVVLGAVVWATAV